MPGQQLGLHLIKETASPFFKHDTVHIVQPDSPAHASGALFCGDSLLEINIKSVDGESPSDDLVAAAETVRTLRVLSCHAPAGTGRHFREADNSASSSFPPRAMVTPTGSLGRLLCRENASRDHLEEGVGLLESCWRENPSPDTSAAFACGMLTQAKRWMARINISSSHNLGTLVMDAEAIALRAHTVCSTLVGVADLLGDCRFHAGDLCAAEKWYCTEIDNGASDGKAECGLAHVVTDPVAAAQHRRTAANRGNLGARLLVAVADGSIQPKDGLSGPSWVQPAFFELCARGFLTAAMLDRLLVCLGPAAMAELLQARDASDQRTAIETAVAHGHRSVVEDLRRFTLQKLVAAVAQSEHCYLAPAVAEAPSLSRLAVSIQRYEMIEVVAGFCKDLNDADHVMSLARALSEAQQIQAANKVLESGLARFTYRLRTWPVHERRGLLHDAVTLITAAPDHPETSRSQFEFWELIGRGWLDSVASGDSGTLFSDEIGAVATLWVMHSRSVERTGSGLPQRIMSDEMTTAFASQVTDLVLCSHLLSYRSGTSRTNWHFAGVSLVSATLLGLCNSGDASMLSRAVGAEDCVTWFAKICTELAKNTLETALTHWNLLPVITRCCVCLWTAFSPAQRTRVLDAIDSFVVGCSDRKTWEGVLEVIDTMKLETRGKERCRVCTDRLFSPETVTAVMRYQSEAYSHPGCTHRFCKGCLEHWVTAQLDEYTAHVPCPETSCPCVLSVRDVSRICSEDVLKRFR
eukprot:m.85561 g.85561  ORF g.85561 m.85561 type:complete len:751 (-) comp11397_c1_seq1:648-2900(-)